VLGTSLDEALYERKGLTTFAATAVGEIGVVKVFPKAFMFL